jgi:hypothetical protein
MDDEGKRTLHHSTLYLTHVLTAVDQEDKNYAGLDGEDDNEIFSDVFGACPRRSEQISTAAFLFLTSA